MATLSENADIAVLQTEMRTVKDATLSTTTNSETNSYLTTKSSPGSVVRSAIRAKAEDTVTVTSATTYHLLMRVAGSGTLSIGIRGDDAVTGIKAVCTYL